MGASTPSSGWNAPSESPSRGPRQQQSEPRTSRVSRTTRSTTEHEDLTDCGQEERTVGSGRVGGLAAPCTRWRRGGRTDQAHKANAQRVRDRRLLHRLHVPRGRNQLMRHPALLDGDQPPLLQCLEFPALLPRASAGSTESRATFGGPLVCATPVGLGLSRQQSFGGCRQGSARGEGRRSRIPQGTCGGGRTSCLSDREGKRRVRPPLRETPGHEITV